MFNPKNIIKFVAAAALTLPLLTTAAPLALEGASKEVNDLLVQRRKEVQTNGKFAKLMRDRSAAAAKAGGQDDLVYERLEQHFSDFVKHHLDRDVSIILRNDQMAKEIEGQVEIIVNSFLADYRRAHLTSAVLAMEGQELEDLKNMASFAAQASGFSRDAYENPEVYFVNQGVLNAYTWSGNREKIQMAFFEGLVTNRNATPEVLLSIIGHEVGHIRFGHIRNSIALNIIFNTTGRILVPMLAEKAILKNSPKAETAEELVEQQARISEFAAEMEASLESNIKRLMSSQLMCNNCGTHKKGTIDDSIIDTVVGDLNNLAKGLAAQHAANPDKLFSLALNLAETLGDGDVSNADSKTDRALRALLSADSRVVRSMDDESDIDAEGDMEEEEIKPQKDFERRMNRLSRSQEISSDRNGVLVAGIQASKLADAMLMGSSSLTPLKKQAQLLAGIYNDRRELAETEKWRENTHPETVFRIEQYETFEPSYVNKVVTSDVLRALFSYASMLSDAEVYAATFKDGRAEARESSVARINYEAFNDEAKVYQAEMFKLLKAEVDRVIALDKGKSVTPKTIPTITKTAEFLREFQSRPSPSVKVGHLVKEGRLIHQLVAYIDEKTSSVKEAHTKAGLITIRGLFTAFGVVVQPVSKKAVTSVAGQVDLAMRMALNEAEGLPSSAPAASGKACSKVVK